MSDTPTPGELVSMMIEASRALDEAQRELLEKVHKEARAVMEYRKARANAYLATEGRTVNEREAAVDKVTAEEGYAARLSEGLAKAALESVRNRRSQLSALQTVASSVKEEAALARTGPSY